MIPYRAGLILSLTIAIGAAAALSGCGGNSAATQDTGSSSALPPPADQQPAVLGAPPPSADQAPPVTDAPSGTSPSPPPGGGDGGGNDNGSGDLCQRLCDTFLQLGCEEDGQVPPPGECLASCQNQLRTNCGPELLAAIACVSRLGCPGDLTDDAAAAQVQAQCPNEASALASCLAQEDTEQ